MKTKDDNETYWSIVVDCLTTFHQWSNAKAKLEVDKFSKSLSAKVTKTEYGLIFHEEPFQLACEISGKSIEIARNSSEYAAILKRWKW